MKYDKMIEKYRMMVVTQNGQEAIKITVRPTNEDIAFIKSNKEEIIARIKQQEAEKNAKYEARKAKIRAIEGLEEIQKAVNAEESYRIAFNRMMDNEQNDGVNPPSRPTASSKELKDRHPRAAAYIMAENWKYADHYAKSKAGEKALEKIINGENYAEAIEEMEAEWKSHTSEHAWD